MKNTLRILTFNHVVRIIAVVMLESQISGMVWLRVLPVAGLRRGMR